MNSAEKKFLFLALFLFALGALSRFGAFNKLSPLGIVSLPMNNEVVSDTIISEAINDTVEHIEEKKEKKPKRPPPQFPIPINTASAEDLCFIKGIGPSLAQKIIDHRETKGPFRYAKDLEKVSGIGAKKRVAIEEFVKFD